MIMRKPLQWLKIILLIFFFEKVKSQDVDFAPRVEASCKSNSMDIKVTFNGPYNGVVHARDHRKPFCMAFGNNTDKLSLKLNLSAKPNTTEHCGILVTHVSGEESEERSVQIAVRVHKTLELAEDKFYIITCNKPGFQRDDSSQVVLKFLDNDKRSSRELAYGSEYLLRAELNQHIDHSNLYNGIKVRNCVAFSKKNTSYILIDKRGCSTDGIISRFIQSSDGHYATSMIPSMFKFPDAAEMQIQCDIILCNEKCTEDKCDDTKSSSFNDDGLSKTDVVAITTTTIFVLDPSAITHSSICDQTGVRPNWLLWLAIILGVLFLIMLLMNLFLCTAMSCSCARTEVIEKEPSIIEEYDPYSRWKV